MSDNPIHFKGKDTLSHVVEVQTRGILASTESHSSEMPGHFSAAADSLRESALVLLLLATMMNSLNISFIDQFLALFIFTLGWLVWKVGRSAWLGWQRLERLHRVMEEEQWEIEHHRIQERDELAVIYRAKGFEGKLLEEVLDVLMADDERLLRVMLEEELGFQLENMEHPLKSGIGAGLGVIFAAIICLISFIFMPANGIVVSALCLLTFGSALSSGYEKNSIIPAMVWNLGLGLVAYSASYFMFKLFL